MVSLFCNIPWTFVGLSFALLSFPKKISFSEKPRAIIFVVKSFWWYTWFPKMKRVRAMAIGNVVLLGKNVSKKSLKKKIK